jgi:hypothetical protein
VAIVALVAALTGAAFAAGGGLTGKEKKEVKKIAKKFAGKPGAPGAPGPTGPQGAAGKDGANGTDGTNGTNGTNGKSVVLTTEAAGANCPDGGTKVEVEGSAASKKYLCNGETGFTETLPSGETETGAWGVYNNSSIVSLSFNIPLASAPTATHYVNPSGEEKVFNPALPGFEFVPATHCTGDFETPTAPPGEICVYAEQETQPAPAFGFFPVGGAQKRFKTGATFLFTLEPGVAQQALGTWAVTAP